MDGWMAGGRELGMSANLFIVGVDASTLRVEQRVTSSQELDHLAEVRLVAPGLLLRVRDPIALRTSESDAAPPPHLPPHLIECSHLISVIVFCSVELQLLCTLLK